MSKIIIYGYSLFSKEIAKELKEKKLHFTIIEHDQPLVDEALHDGYEAYVSNLNHDENLIEAGVTRGAETFFCLSDNHNANLFIILSARALDPKLKIISKASSPEEVKQLELVGVDKAINPYEIGAQRFFRKMLKPTVFAVLDTILFDDSNIKFAEIEIKENSRMCGQEIKEIDLEVERHDLLLIGIQTKEGFIYNTDKKPYFVTSGDVMVVMGKESEIEHVKQGVAS